MDANDSILAEIELQEKEANYFQRLFTGIIDWIVDLAVLVTLYLTLYQEVFLSLIKISAFRIYILPLGIMIIYRIVMMLLFGRTFGMMICGIKYLNDQQMELSNKEKLVAALFIRTAKIKYYKV